MGLLLLLTAVMTAALAGPVAAERYAWCSNFADGASVNYGFTSYEQCMETSRGTGGYCTKKIMTMSRPRHRPVRAQNAASQEMTRRWCRVRGLNSRPSLYKSAALPLS